MRIAVITGAAKGIGAAIADRLARDGMHVVIADLDIAEAQAKAEELGRTGAKASALKMDVGDPASVAQAFATLEREQGRCDAVVNNAGIAKTFPFVEFPL